MHTTVNYWTVLPHCHSLEGCAAAPSTVRTAPYLWSTQDTQCNCNNNNICMPILWLFIVAVANWTSYSYIPLREGVPSLCFRECSNPLLLAQLDRSIFNSAGKDVSMIITNFAVGGMDRRQTVQIKTIILWVNEHHTFELNLLTTDISFWLKFDQTVTQHCALSRPARENSVIMRGLWVACARVPASRRAGVVSCYALAVVGKPWRQRGGILR